MHGHQHCSRLDFYSPAKLTLLVLGATPFGAAWVFDCLQLLPHTICHFSLLFPSCPQLRVLLFVWRCICKPGFTRFCMQHAYLHTFFLPAPFGSDQP
jgi:hypothetical protein